jgi:hypothetical protein
VRSTAAVTILDNPLKEGWQLNFNSLAVPPALLLADTDQLLLVLPDSCHPDGREPPSKLSCKTMLSCAKSIAENNNANVNDNNFFIV